MAKKDYIQQNDLAFALQLNTFKANIGSYPMLGLTPAQVTAQAADADYFNYLVQTQSIMQNDAKATTAWRDADCSWRPSRCLAWRWPWPG